MFRDDVKNEIRNALQSIFQADADDDQFQCKIAVLLDILYVALSVESMESRKYLRGLVHSWVKSEPPYVEFDGRWTSRSNLMAHNITVQGSAEVNIIIGSLTRHMFYAIMDDMRYILDSK